jgi:fibronectin type 3 domain-containing protein
MKFCRPIIALVAVVFALFAGQGHAANKIIRIDHPNIQCPLWLWITNGGDSNTFVDGNANLSQDPATFFNPGTVVTAPAIFCEPLESLPLIWNHDSFNSPGMTPPILEAIQDPPNPASMPDPISGLPTNPGLTAYNAVIYEWINPNDVNNGISNEVPDAEVVVWELPFSSSLPTGGVEIEFDNWCSGNDYSGSITSIPAPTNAVPSFTWKGIHYTYNGTCANFNEDDLLINTSGVLVGYVDSTTNVSTFTPSPNWVATTLAVPVLTATSGSGGIITLTWSATPGATSYNLYASLTPGDESPYQPQTFGIATTTYMTGAYPPGTTTPYFKIAAVYNGAVSGLSNEVVSTALPATPAGLTAMLNGATSISLQWTGSAGATSYNIYQGTSSGAESATPIASGITGSTYTVAGLSPGQTYFFDAVAVDAGGKSAASNEAKGTLLAAPPTGLNATDSAASIALHWTASAGATSYNVYQGSSSGAESVTPIASGITGTTYTVAGVSPGQTYFFDVVAVNGAGKSAMSNETMGTILASAPTGLNASDSAASIVLQWTASAGASNYKIYQGTTSGGESATPIVSGISGTTYTVTGLNPGQTYFFDVVAVDAGGNSVASNQATTTMLAAAPTALSATASNGTVTLTWSASAGATSYDIYQGTSASGESNSPAVSSVMGTSTTISGLTNGQTYYFKVAAADAGGVSAQSNEASAMPAMPAAPSSSGGGAIGLIDLLILSGLVIFPLRPKRRADRRVENMSQLGSPSVFSGSSYKPLGRLSLRI